MPKKTKAEQHAAGSRRWRSSAIGIGAESGILLLKLAFTQAREAGAAVDEGSVIDLLWKEAQAAYENARELFLAGHEAEAARHAMYIGAAAGCIANDREWIAKQLATLNARKSAGMPRPRAVKPLTRALERLVQEGLTNDEIVDVLRDADAADRRVGRIIHILERDNDVGRESGVCYYLPGQHEDEAQVVTAKTLQNKLALIRSRVPD